MTAKLTPIYLDNNATTLIEESALSALLFFSSNDNFGNVSSVHWAGRKVKSAWEEAHENVAALIKAKKPEEICFTGSATEASNAAIKGAFFQHLQSGQTPATFYLFTSVTEHEATLESARFIQRMGATVTFVPVDKNGLLDLDALAQALVDSRGKGQRMMSFLAANNETGVISPLEQICSLAKSEQVLLHIDAVQAPGKMEFDLEKYPAQLLSLSAHKIGGPKGVGALYIQRGTELVSLLHGGAQERNRRAGTIDVGATVAFGAAAKVVALRVPSADLRKHLESEVERLMPGVHIQGRNAPRISNTSNFIFDGVRGESLLMGLDMAGFAVSSGSACNSGSIGPSHVLMAMGWDKHAASSAVRVSLSHHNTRAEVDAFVVALDKVVRGIRQQQSKRSNLPV